MRDITTSSLCLYTAIRCCAISLPPLAGRSDIIPVASRPAAEHESRERQSLSCGFVHLGFVRVVAQIAPNPDVVADLAAHLDERLHDDRAGISNLAQRRSDFVPGQPAFPRNAAVVLAGMEMTEQGACGSDRLAETILLDVHMERIEHNLDVGLADLPDECHSLFRGVEDVCRFTLEPETGAGLGKE